MGRRPPDLTRGIGPELVERLETALDAFARARLEMLAERPNAFDLRLTSFGASLAPAALRAPELDFVNRISLAPGDGRRLDEILAYYGGLGLRPWLEPSPLLALTLPAGGALVGSQAVLYGPAVQQPEEGPSVRETEDARAAARLLLATFGVPADVIETDAPALAAAVARVGGRFFLAEVDGRAAAAAIVTLRDGVGYLAMAGTLPDARGRGCQQALIRARIASAAAAGCDLVVATAAFPSPSHRNLERCGLRTAYTKPVLRLTPPGG